LKIVRHLDGTGATDYLGAKKCDIRGSARRIELPGSFIGDAIIDANIRAATMNELRAGGYRNTVQPGFCCSDTGPDFAGACCGEITAYNSDVCIIEGDVRTMCGFDCAVVCVVSAIET